MKHQTGGGGLWRSGTMATYFTFLLDYQRSLQFKLRRLH